MSASPPLSCKRIENEKQSSSSDRARTHLEPHVNPALPCASSAAAAGSDHRLRGPQPPHPGREPPHRHIPRLLSRAVAGPDTRRLIPALLRRPIAVVPRVPPQQRRRGPAPPPAARCGGLERSPADPPRRPERRRRRCSGGGGGAVPGAHPLRAGLGTGSSRDIGGGGGTVEETTGRVRETLDVGSVGGGVGKRGFVVGWRKLEPSP
jgi:hypothetical protein